ncbi:dihydrofolate reductase [Deinococcus multiflagellatus]|uniref:dihydrofolate reductase n=1 Tax=Deinococcus multiflagellatus TaxID=1656887 RepID=A0ABW1ZNX0_9DEIO
MAPELFAIVAMTPGRVIGRGGTLPWRLPADLAHFRRHSLGVPNVMGRKVWDSLGAARCRGGPTSSSRATARWWRPGPRWCIAPKPPWRRLGTRPA